MSALRKVLVVDDDPVVGKGFNRVLTDEKGYIVVTAQNAHEALERIREENYDLVFTDIKMPGMDGVELAERVKSLQPWVPVVIVTGYGTTDNEVRAKAAGVSAFMRKPLSPQMIEDSAHDALLHLVAMPVSQALPVDAPVQDVQVRPLASHSKVKDIALLMAVPLMGLTYAVLLPLGGLVTLAWMGLAALAAKPLTRKVAHHAKNVALFLAAPFIGLVYAALLPLVGLGMLACVGWLAFAANPKNAKAVHIVKQTGSFIAAPFVGLLFVLMLPVVGTALLAWIGIRSLMAPNQVQ
jgi:CheY-like chemotaxis protein